MEINKQLFEDVLSGKLKGTFVFRDGRRCNSYCIYINNFYLSSSTHPYCINGASYRPDGTYSDNIYEESELDIVDFIPETNMKENELTIEIPDNKVVDWDESKKQNKIVLKDKQLTYEDVCKKLFKDGVYYTNESGEIDLSRSTIYITDPNNAITEHQLKCILAKNQLANVAVYLNDGWKPSKTDSGHFDAWVLFMTPNKDYIGYVKITKCSENSNVLFKSKELAQQAIEILGKETVKLALEPLGI